MNRHLRIALFSLLGFFGLFGTAQSSHAQLARSGRWLTYNGASPYFVGYDFQQLFSQKSYSYADVDYKLNQLKEFRVNKIRVWADNWFMGTGAYLPWTSDGNGIKNLDSWDNTYWTRVKDFIQKCKDRDIVVEFTIFSAYPYKTESDEWWKNTSWKTAWNKSFNTNGVFSTNGSGNFWPDFFDLNHSEQSSSGKTLRDYQKALIDKSIDELKSFGNVYFEVHNEFPGAWLGGEAINQVYPWQQHWANYMHFTKGALTTCHANEGSGQNTWGIQYFKDQPYVDVLNFHFRTARSDGVDDGNIDHISAFLHDLQRTGKVLQSNESRAYEDSTYTDSVTREAWGMLLSGGYYFHYNDSMDPIGSTAWRATAERLKVLRNVAESVPFWQMSPVDANGNEYDPLVSAGPGDYWQVMANIGNEYLAYFSANPTTTAVRINLPTAQYSYRFYDTQTWNSNGITSGTVSSSGGTVNIPAPSPSLWNAKTGLALVIKKTGITIPSAPSQLKLKG